MQESIMNIDKLLSELLINPKQATGKIDIQYHKNSDFISLLTAYIINQDSLVNQFDQTLVKLGLTTFNSLACRFMQAEKNISDYFIIDEMFVNCKKILFCNNLVCTQIQRSNNTKFLKKRLNLRNKILVVKSLTLFIEHSSLNFSQIKNLIEQAYTCESVQSLLIILQAVLNSSIDRIIKMKSIELLFSPILDSIQSNLNIILTLAYHPYIIYQIQKQQLKGCVGYSQCFFVVEYWSRLVYQCTKIFNQAQNSTEFEIIQAIYSGNFRFLCMIRDIVEWRDKYNRIMWQDNIYGDNNLCILSLSKINKLKSLTFSIINAILCKTSKSFNLELTDNPLMNRIPNLCQQILSEIQQSIMLLLKKQRIPYIKEVISQLDLQIISKMFGFLAQCVYFTDCQSYFMSICLQRNTIQLLAIFLTPLGIQLQQFENQPDNFAEYLNSLNNPSKQSSALLPRITVSKFINACCDQIDGFTTYWFQGCFKTLLFYLNRKFSSNHYSNLTLFESEFDNNPLGVIQNNMLLKGDVSLLGILAISHQTLNKRADLQQVLKNFLRVICLEHLNQLQLSIFYEILADNPSWIKQTESQIEDQIDNGKNSLLLQYSRFISYVYTNIDEEESSCLIIGLNFVSQIYTYVLTALSEIERDKKLKGKKVYKSKFIEDEANQADEDIISEQSCQNFSQIYQVIAYEYVWPPLKQKIKYSKSFYFFQSLTQISSYFQDSQDILINQDCQLIIDLLSKISVSIRQSLILCCQKLSWLYRQQTHDQLLCYKIYHTIKTLMIELHTVMEYIFNKNHQNRNEQILKIGVIIQHFLQQCLLPCKNGNIDYAQQISLDLQQQQGFIELAEILLNWNIFVSENIMSALFPILLKSPFCQGWLNSISYYTHKIKGQFNLSQIYLLIQKIGSILHDKLTFYELPQSKKMLSFQDFQKHLNQLCIFIGIVLSYSLPEQWNKIHQLLRIHLIKCFKIYTYNPNSGKKSHSYVITKQKWKPLQITIMRLFHVYLSCYKLQTRSDILQQIVNNYQDIIQKYTVVQATNLILTLKLSLEYIPHNYIKQIFSIIVLILKKLFMNKKYFGCDEQTKWKVQIRQLSDNIVKIIAHDNIDPYHQFRIFLRELQGTNYKQLIKQGHINDINQLKQIQVIKGEPRKLVNIKRK